MSLYEEAAQVYQKITVIIYFKESIFVGKETLEKRIAAAERENDRLAGLVKELKDECTIIERQLDRVLQGDEPTKH